MKTRTRSNAAGFTLAELMIIVGVIGVTDGRRHRRACRTCSGRRKADGSTAIVVNALRLARDRAISERRNMDVVFVPPNRIKIVREEIVYNCVTGTWSSTYGRQRNPTVMDVYLEGNQRFMYFDGHWGHGTDGFGLTNKPLAFGTMAARRRRPSCSPARGPSWTPPATRSTARCFSGPATDVDSARAVTIFGMTGLVRSWKWDGRKWIE